MILGQMGECGYPALFFGGLLRGRDRFEMQGWDGEPCIMLCNSTAPGEEERSWFAGAVCPLREYASYNSLLDYSI